MFSRDLNPPLKFDGNGYPKSMVSTMAVLGIYVKFSGVFLGSSESCPFPLLHKYHKGELHKGPNLSNISDDSILPTDFTRKFPSMLKKIIQGIPRIFFVQINPCPACHSPQLQGGGASRKTLLIAPTVSLVCECLVVRKITKKIFPKLLFLYLFV